MGVDRGLTRRLSVMEGGRDHQVTALEVDVVRTRLTLAVRAGMIACTPRERVAAQAWMHLGMKPPTGVSGLGQGRPL